MLFTHRVRPEWVDRIPAVVHVDGTARIQTVDPADEPLVARMLEGFERRTGLPVVVNTSLNTAGRPMVDDPRDALECFGSAPVDALAIGPFLVRRRPCVSFDVVVPTVGRASLTRLLDALLDGSGPRPARVVLVDDRVDPSRAPDRRSAARDGVVVLPSGGRGPAAARNVGWRAGSRRVGRLPRRRRGAAARLARPRWPPTCTTCPTHVGGQPGPHGRPPARGPAADRLGAQRRRPGVGPVGHGRHGLPAGRPGRRRRLRRALPPGLPGGRRPRRPRAWPPAGGSSRGARRVHSTRSAPPTAGSACASRPATPTTPSCAPCTAAAGGSTGVPPGRRARHLATTARRRGARSPALLGRRRPLAVAGAAAWAVGHGRVRLGPASRPGPAPATRSPPWPLTIGRHPARRHLALAARLGHAARPAPPPAGGAAGAAGSRRRPVRPRRHARRRRPLQRRPGARSCPCPAPARRSTGSATPASRPPSSPTRAASPAGWSPPSRWTRSTARSRSCSARWARGPSARTASTTAARCRKPAAGLVLAGRRGPGRRPPPGAPWSATSAPTSRPPAPPAPAACSCPTAATRPGGGRRRARGGRRPGRPPSTCLIGSGR